MDQISKSEVIIWWGIHFIHLKGHTDLDNVALVT